MTTGPLDARSGPSARTALRVLLIGGDGTEPTFLAWRAALLREGVPFDEHVSGRDARLTYAVLARGTTEALYGTVIVAVDGPRRGPSILAVDERAALERMERQFGIRRVTAFVEPSTAVGLGPPAYAGRLHGVGGVVSPAGRSVFDYLVGEVPVDPQASGYLAPPLDDTFRTFVEGPAGAALVGVRTHADGREELVTTVDTNAGMLHFQLLRQGMLAWATRGVHFGSARDYFSLHIDDVFFLNARWDPEGKANRDESVSPIRMAAADALELVAWQERTGVMVELLFNGAEVERDADDELNVALLARRNSFRWTSHTFDHLLLDGPDPEPLVSSIVENVRFAGRAGIPQDPTEVVTGEHSGLDNPVLAEALERAGIRWIGSDASRERDQRQIGPALTVPRYPSGVCANVGRREELLDQDGHLHRASIGWDEFVDREATEIFGHVVGNDPRPHFFHQSNLAEDRLFYPVVDAVLERHRRYFRTPIHVPRMTESGTILRRQARWAAAVREGLVRGWRIGDTVAVEAEIDLDVPLAFCGEWLPVTPGYPLRIGIPGLGA